MMNKVLADRRWGVPETLATGDESTNPLSVIRVWLRSDGTFPNNERYPLLVFKLAMEDPRREPLEGEQLLVANGWTAPWAWGVFSYHHYHSKAWEALVCVRGEADIQFGGPSGPVLQTSIGDLILIPPGVAHKQLQSHDDFTLLGSYPNETPSADTVRSAPSASQQESIDRCLVPASDPVFGENLMPWGAHFRALFEAPVLPEKKESCAI